MCINVCEHLHTQHVPPNTPPHTQIHTKSQELKEQLNAGRLFSPLYMFFPILGGKLILRAIFFNMVFPSTMITKNLHVNNTVGDNVQGKFGT